MHNTALSSSKKPAAYPRSFPHPVFQCDDDGYVVHANALALALSNTNPMHRRFDDMFSLFPEIPGREQLSGRDRFSLRDTIRSNAAVHACEVSLIQNDNRKTFMLSCLPSSFTAERKQWIIILTDITPQKQAEERMGHYLQDVAFLSHSAMHLVNHVSEEDLYHYLTKQVYLLINDGIVVTTSYNQLTDEATIRSLLAPKNDTALLTRLFKKPLQLMKLSLHGVLKDILDKRENHLTLIPKEHVFSILSQHISSSSISLVRRKLNLGNFYFTPLSCDRHFIGSLLIITRTRVRLQNHNLIEALARQVTMALRRQQAELLLREERDKAKRYLDIAGAMIFVIDAQQKVRLINKKGCALLGYLESSIVGKNWFDTFVAKHRREEIRQKWLHFTKNSRKTALRYDFPLVTRKGEERIIRCLTTLFTDDTGASYATLSSGEDITEIRKAEEVLRRDKESFARMVEKKTGELLAAQKDIDNTKRLSDVGMLAATIAHELRNPLGVMWLATYNIRKKTKSALVGNHLLTIEKKILESNQIISNLLSYSRLKMPLYETVSLSTMIVENVETVTKRYPMASISFKQASPSARNDLVTLDPLQFRQLLANILDNACEAFPGGKGHIHIRSSYASRGRFSLVVSDNGAGIPPDVLPKVFEPFFTTKLKGTGLGLTICYQIVKLHGGTITIKSPRGKGTTVSVTFPTSKPANNTHFPR